jgi:hypothetical protein
MTVQDVLSRLKRVKRAGKGGWTACCPAHEDRNPSLSIREGDGGRVLLRCHAGCTYEQITGTLGFGRGELAGDCAVPSERWTPRGEAVAVYPYLDENGKLLFEVCRTADKQFPQRRPDPLAASGYAWKLNGVRRVPYRLPELLTRPEGAPVYVVEGERDVHALEGVGAVATCNPGGAGKWRTEYNEHFRGADVVVIADRDQPGRQHAEAVARSLATAAASVRIVEAAEGKDAADHLAAGYGLADFRTPEWEPNATAASGPAQTLGFITDAGLSDLPPLEWTIDGVLPAGGQDYLVGMPGTGKTLVALDWACCITTGRAWYGRAVKRGPVIYIAGEGARSLRSRLEVWKGYNNCEGLETGVRWLPRRVSLADAIEVAEFIATAKAACPEPALVVIDTLPRCTQGVSENDADGIGRALEAVDRIREELGAGVLLLTHPSREGGNLPRGHSSQDGAADAIWSLRENDGERVLSCSKLKDGDETLTFSLRLVSVLDRSFYSLPTRHQSHGVSRGISAPSSSRYEMWTTDPESRPR